MSKREKTTSGRKGQTEQAGINFRLKHGGGKHPTMKRLVAAKIEELKAAGWTDLAAQLFVIAGTDDDPEIQKAAALVALKYERTTIQELVDERTAKAHGMDAIDYIRASSAKQLVDILGMSEREACERVALHYGGGNSLDASRKYVYGLLKQLDEDWTGESIEWIDPVLR